MPNAWTRDALVATKALLEGDATLAGYVEAWETWPHDRPRAFPDVQRHGGAIFPLGGDVPAPAPPLCHDSTYRIGLRLFVFIWDPTADARAIDGVDVAGGPGSAEVGIMQFIRDVQHAVRGTTLSGTVLSTYTEADNSYQTAAPPPERERVVVEQALVMTLRKFTRTDGSDG